MLRALGEFGFLEMGLASNGTEKINMLDRTRTTDTLSAAPLTPGTPLIGYPPKITNRNEHKARLGRERARKKRRLDKKGLTQVTITPPERALHEALRAYARHSEDEAGPVADAVARILAEEPGWETDDALLTTMGNAMAAEWIKRWRRFR